MNILVTGASGFLGKFLVQALKEKNHHVTEVNSKNCDLTKAESLDQFDSISFDKIYHLAAWTQAGDFCLKHPGEQWIINQQINTNMLTFWAKKHPKAKFIAIGTSCSYDPTLSLQEENYLTGKPIDSLFTYAMTKRMLLTGLMALHKQYQMDYLYLIPSTLYGPSYHQDGRQMHFIFDLIRKILLGVKQDFPVVLWGTGEQIRELIHVNDFVRIMLSLDEKAKNTHINIGAGKGYPIKHFAHLIADIAGYPKDKITYDISKYVGAKAKVLEASKLQEYLPDCQMIPLNEGLYETIQWFNRKCKATLHH